MEWLQANWVWLLILMAFIGMHMGHGHGGHGPHGPGGDEETRHGRGGGCH